MVGGKVVTRVRKSLCPPYSTHQFFLLFPIQSEFNILSMKKGYFILISSVLLIFVVGFVLIIRKMTFKQNIVRIARAELKKWTGLTETSQKASQILIEYWKSVGRTFTATQMQSASVHSTYPWSSAFISWLFFKAGAKDRFPYSAAHSGYLML